MWSTTFRPCPVSLDTAVNSFSPTSSFRLRLVARGVPYMVGRTHGGVNSRFSIGAQLGCDTSLWRGVAVCSRTHSCVWLVESTLRCGVPGVRGRLWSGASRNVLMVQSLGVFVVWQVPCDCDHIATPRRLSLSVAGLSVSPCHRVTVSPCVTTHVINRHRDTVSSLLTSVLLWSAGICHLCVNEVFTGLGTYFRALVRRQSQSPRDTVPSPPHSLARSQCSWLFGSLVDLAVGQWWTS